LSYALLPHAGDWKSANLWMAAGGWNEPLLAALSSWETGIYAKPRSLVAIAGGDWEITSMRANGNSVLIRFFNASLDEDPKTLRYNGPASKIELVQLNGQSIREIVSDKDADGVAVFKLALPRLGIGTIRITP
jgi:alpha-mannosidase